MQSDKRVDIASKMSEGDHQFIVGMKHGMEAQWSDALDEAWRRGYVAGCRDTREESLKRQEALNSKQPPRPELDKPISQRPGTITPVHPDFPGPLSWTDCQLPLRAGLRCKHAAMEYPIYMDRLISPTGVHEILLVEGPDTRCERWVPSAVDVSLDWYVLPKI